MIVENICIIVLRSISTVPDLMLRATLRPTGRNEITAEQRYKYNPLPDRSIRPLKLQPTIFGIRCSIVVTSLDAVPSYEAIPYTRRSPEKAFARIVVIDGQPLPIPKSAYEILVKRFSI